MYVDMYSLLLSNAVLSPEDREEMKNVEEELNYEELAVLRKVAMQRVRAQHKVSSVQSSIHCPVVS